AASSIAFGYSSETGPGLIATEMAVDLWKSGYHFKIDRFLARCCDSVVGNSDAVVAFYRDRVRIPADKLRRVYSGIEMNEADEMTPEMKFVARNELKLNSDDGPVILFAGRLAEQKRVEDLLKAADILQHLYPKLKVIIAGEGPLKQQLIEFCRNVELGEKVKFVGHCANMQRLYSAADIVVLPSSYEGLPNVVMEAQLRALPVVAAAAPGTIELVKYRETGLTFPIGDSTELARLLQELITNPNLGESLGKAGREMIRHSFSVEQMTDHFEKLYFEFIRTTQKTGGL
ncbi:MAG: glycosyltransferase family 4 protein, partial [bacterium]